MSVGNCMKLFITVKPKSKEERIEKIDDTHFVVRVKAPAREGKANAAVMRALARYFGVAPSAVEIVSRHTSRIKIVEV